MYKFKHDIPRYNLKIAEWMNKISITGETYSEILSQTFNLYFTSLCPLFKDYMDKRRNDWEEDKEFTAEQVSAVAPNNYNKLFNSRRWSNKDTKDDHILSLVAMAQNIADDSKKASEKPSRETTKGDPAFIRDLPTWIL